MKKNIIVFLYVMFLGNCLWAGDTISHSRTWVMGMPQHLFNNGVRIELDKEISPTGKWITLSPVVYYRGREANWISDRGGFESMSGGGLGIYYRYFPKAMGKSFNLYLMTGGGYEFISFKVRGIRWETIENDGLEFYTMGDSDFFNSHLHTFEIRATVGFKWLLDKHLAVDVFAGPELGYSFIGGGDNTLFPSYDGYFRYGKNGIGVAGGIRIGVGW
jgi:hypothetical protein